MSRERLRQSFFSREEIEKIIKRQGNKSFFNNAYGIEDYHHEPSRAELLRVGIKNPDISELGMGLLSAYHAAIHYVKRRMGISREDNWSAVVDITNRMPEWQFAVYDEILNSRNKLDIIEKEIVRRRKQWRIEC